MALIKTKSIRAASLLCAALTLLEILSGGCSKNKYSSSLCGNSLYGKWHWVETSGGFAGVTYRARADSNVVLNLYTNGAFEQTLNGHVNSSGSFILGTAPDRSGNPQQTITLGSSIPEYLQMRNDSLMLTDGFDDGFSSVYIRVH